MSFPKQVVESVCEYVAGHEGWREANLMAAAANADLFYGDTSSEDYPGFEAACRQVSDFLDEVGCFYVDEDSGCVTSVEPEGAWVSDEECDGEAIWQEPMPYYALTPHDVATILFGSELAGYLR